MLTDRLFSEDGVRARVKDGHLEGGEYNGRRVGTARVDSSSAPAFTFACASMCSTSVDEFILLPDSPPAR